MKTNETGRSMVEMLAVLSIIGILSVAGIYGYSTAMRRHRANEIMQTASLLAVMAQSANSGEGDCIELASSNLAQKPGGVDVEMVATPAEGESKIVDIKINDSDADGLCDIVSTSPYVDGCGYGDINTPCSGD